MTPCIDLAVASFFGGLLARDAPHGRHPSKEGGVKMSEILRGNDLGDFCDLLWANASRRAFAASPSSPDGLQSLSQEQLREPAQPNKRAGSNNG